MNDEFSVQSSSQSQGPILAAIFNENIHEIITVGPGYLTVSTMFLLVPRRRLSGAGAYCIRVCPFARLSVCRRFLTIRGVSSTLTVFKGLF